MRILSHHLHPTTVTLAIVEFCFALVAVYGGALLRHDGALSAAAMNGPIMPRALMFASAVVVGLTALGLYQARQRWNAEAVAVRMGLGLGLAAVGLALIYFVIPTLALGRGWSALSFGLVALLLATDRVLFFKLVDEEVFRRRVLVYGAGDRAASLLMLRRKSDQRGFRIVRFCPAPGDRSLIDDDRVKGAEKSLLDMAKDDAVDEIVVAMDDRRQGFPIAELLDCKFAGISVVEVLTFMERESGRVTLDLVNPSWMIFSDGFTRSAYRNTLTRLFDIVAGVFGLLIAWPFILAAALAVLIEDGRPIFYRQARVGLLGKKFQVIKLRSMRVDAESDGSAQWAQENDSRVTRVGHLIRKLRLDELPQFINILLGDMSLVGPRPERPEFVDELANRIPYYQERHCVKPGLTGWAQLSYGYGASERDSLRKLQYDLYYVKNQSLIFDLMILLQTVEVVVLQKGSR